MAAQNVTATRMTLLKYKNQQKVAQRGHKLLKDKQDGLMQEFLQIVHKAKALRVEVEKAIKNANGSFLLAQSVIPKEIIQNTFANPTQKLSLKVKTKNVMSVKIPVFTLETEGNALDYGMSQTRGQLDLAISEFAKVFNLLLQLTEIEKSAENLALEIEKTRRRVNALEYRLIPDIKDTLKLIKMKLDENERSAIVQVMAVKNMIVAQEERADKARRATLATA